MGGILLPSLCFDAQINSDFDAGYPFKPGQWSLSTQLLAGATRYPILYLHCFSPWKSSLFPKEQWFLFVKECHSRNEVWPWLFPPTSFLIVNSRSSQRMKQGINDTYSHIIIHKYLHSYMCTYIYLVLSFLSINKLIFIWISQVCTNSSSSKRKHQGSF